MNYSNCLSPIGMKCKKLSTCLRSPDDVVIRTDINKNVIGWGMKLLDIPRYWEIAKGEGVRIAVLDTGVVTGHPNLEGAIDSAVDFTAGRENVEDTQGHGTHCIGIIAAQEDTKGPVGVAPLAKIYSAKIVDNKGVSSIDALVKAIQWAIQKEVHIISISLACSNDNKSMKEVILQATNAGIFVVSAVGNDGNTHEAVKFPAKYKEVIAVGAIDRYLNITSCSNQGTEIDIVAPGEEVLSTYPPNTFAEMNGTSTAVPFAVGLLTLLLSKYFKDQECTTVQHYQELKQHFIQSTIGLGTIGWNKIYGHGITNTKALLSKVISKDI